MNLKYKILMLFIFFLILAIYFLLQTYEGNDTKSKIIVENKPKYASQVMRNLGVHRLHNEGFSGNGITIAVLDTGTYEHQELIYPTMKIIAFKDFVNDFNLPYDDNGHGTFIAGIISGNGESNRNLKGVAFNSKIVSIKVLDENGEAPVSRIIDGLNWVLTNKDQYNIKLINLSFNVELSDQDYRKELGKVIKQLTLAGITIVTSVGNLNSDLQGKTSNITYPSFDPSVITVGSSEKIAKDIHNRNTFQLASFSIHEKKGNMIKPDIHVPGTKISSIDSYTNYLPGKEKLLASTTRVDTGTSLSAAMITGVIALWIEQDPSLSTVEIKEKLKKNSVPTQVNGKFNNNLRTLHIKD